MQRYKEKIDNQWYQTYIELQLGKAPFIPRLFGKHETSVDEEFYGSIQVHVEISYIVYKKKFYIYRTQTTKRVKVYNPKMDFLYEDIWFDECELDGKHCRTCNFHIRPNKCFERDIIALHGGFTKANYVIIKKEEFEYIRLDQNCPGYEKTRRNI